MLPHHHFSSSPKISTPSKATAKGYMNQTRKSLKSTSAQKNNKKDIEEDFNPPQVEEAEVELFVGATIAHCTTN
jgi:hypothetical protein